jgi:hypothetical protein
MFLSGKNSKNRVRQIIFYRYLKKMIKKIELFQDVDRVFSFENTVTKK